jgi:hypothetical protein
MLTAPWAIKRAERAQRRRGGGGHRGRMRTRRGGGDFVVGGVVSAVDTMVRMTVVAGGAKQEPTT